MSIDPQASAHAVRTLRDGERDGVATKIAMVRVVFPTSQSDLWGAVTSSERIPEWFLPVSGDLEVGGRFQTEGNAGGVIESCNAPNSYAATWEFGGQVSWIRVELEQDEDGTALILTHEAAIGDGAFWKQYGPGATGVGWELGFLALSVYVDQTTVLDPADVGVWAESAEAHPYIRNVAEAWADAAIAAGDDPDEARAAAVNTYRFYTGTAEG